jgi:hypothetical protein
MVHLSYKHKITDKELSRYCDAGAKGERKYSSYSFLSSVLDGGEWPASRLRPLFARGKGPPVHIVKKTGWASELIWTRRLEKISTNSAGNKTPVIQSTDSRNTD